MSKLLVISVAGLGYDLAAALERKHGKSAFPGGALHPAASVFPAVTCTAQASFRTAAPPTRHGMVANGFFDRRWRKAAFWEQASSLVEGERIWHAFRAAGRTVGLVFWQQSMGEDADLVLTPAPIHKHGGGTILDCYSQPAALYPRLRRTLGEFPLARYWGPLASARVGDWIADATADVMRHEAPDLLLAYLPTLDYDLQRHGPNHPRAAAAADRLRAQLQRLATAADKAGYDLLFWGDYAIAPCQGPALLPNLSLHETGLFQVRSVRGRAYPDFHRSRAFALCDHEVAHLYVREARDLPTLRAWASAFTEAACVPPATEERHPNGGDLVLIAAPGRWFAYPWWRDPREAPDYARHIDIHNKPGFDPCELNFSWFPPGISLDTTRIRGTHGRPERPVAWGGTLTFDPLPASLLDLAARLRERLAP